MAVAEKSTRTRKTGAGSGSNRTPVQAAPSQSATSVLPSTGPASRPLEAYATILAVFLGGHVVASLAGKLPNLRPLDLLLLSLATFRFGRVLVGDRVTAPLRAPFVQTTAQRVDDTHAEVEEVPKGSGLKVAVGQLVTCPSCASFWGAALQTWGLMVAPRLTRPLIWLLAASGASEIINQLASARQRAEDDSATT